MISTHIGAPAGDTAEICVEDNTVNEVAGVEPNFTAVAPFRLVPLMITVVPPATGPEAGDTDETVGAGIGGTVVVVVVVVGGTVVVVVVVGGTVVVVVVVGGTVVVVVVVGGTVVVVVVVGGTVVVVVVVGGTVVVVVVVGGTVVVVVVVGGTVVVVVDVVVVVVVVVVAGDTNTVVSAVDTSPSPSVTISETGYEPTVVYRALASAVVAVCPLPKFHA